MAKIVVKTTIAKMSIDDAIEIMERMDFEDVTDIYRECRNHSDILIKCIAKEDEMHDTTILVVPETPEEVRKMVEHVRKKIREEESGGKHVI